MNEKQADMDIMTHDCSGDSMSVADLDGATYEQGHCLNCGRFGIMEYGFASGALCNRDCERMFRASLDLPAEPAEPDSIFRRD